MDPRISLFDTVMKMHEAGTTKLSASDMDLISRETRSLIEKSLKNKTAAKMPEGFDEVLKTLKSEDPEAAFEAVLSFLKEKGILKDKEEKSEKKPEGKPEGKFDKGEKPAPHKEKMGPKGEEPEPGESLEHEKMESPAEEKFEHEAMPKGAQAEPMVDEAEGEEGKDRLKDIQKKVDAVPETTSVESMGMMEDKKGGKYRVLITAERNLVAQDVEKGPLFHAIPSQEYKRSPVLLKRLANQVMGTLMFQGPKAAAAFCGTTLLAGVDDDVQTTGDMPVEPNKDSVSDNAQVVSEGGVSAPPKDSLEGADNDTKEDPDKVNPTNREGRTVAKYEVVKRADTAIDGVDTDTKEKPDDAVKDVRDGAENVTKEDQKKPDEDVTKGGEVDFQSVEASYRQLYAARAKKAVEEAVKAAMDKFYACVRIASSRMRLNQDAHPFKIAAVDVLLSDNVEFTNGDAFVPMDVRTASELIELISVEGHDSFVSHLLARAADLMEKDAVYLKDVEEDLKTLAPMSVSVEPTKSAGVRKTSLRDRAIEGSLMSENRAAQRPERNKNVGVREAMVGNRLGRQLSSLKK